MQEKYYVKYQHRNNQIEEVMSLKILNF